jgi:hypothetical protein
MYNCCNLALTCLPHHAVDGDRMRSNVPFDPAQFKAEYGIEVRNMSPPGVQTCLGVVLLKDNMLIKGTQIPLYGHFSRDYQVWHFAEGGMPRPSIPMLRLRDDDDDGRNVFLHVKAGSIGGHVNDPDHHPHCKRFDHFGPGIFPELDIVEFPRRSYQDPFRVCFVVNEDVTATDQDIELFVHYNVLWHDTVGNPDQHSIATLTPYSDVAADEHPAPGSPYLPPTKKRKPSSSSSTSSSSSSSSSFRMTTGGFTPRRRLHRCVKKEDEEDEDEEDEEEEEEEVKEEGTSSSSSSSTTCSSSSSTSSTTSSSSSSSTTSVKEEEEADRHFIPVVMEAPLRHEGDGLEEGFVPVVMEAPSCVDTLVLESVGEPYGIEFHDDNGDVVRTCIVIPGAGEYEFEESSEEDGPGSPRDPGDDESEEFWALRPPLEDDETVFYSSA